MTKPVTIPNTFATATTAIPLSQLDSDFSTVATALNDANTYSNYAADTGVANAYVVTLSGVSTTYSAGLRIQFKAGAANTGASTLNVNGGGTKNITFQDASTLSSGTIAANSIVDVMYDGTQFLLMNDPAGATGGDVVGPSSATDNAIVRFDGTTGKLVQNSVVTIADSTGDISGVGTLNATTLDATNIEVTNIKAKDGTAAATIADSTGVVTVTAAPVMTALTASQAVFTTAGKALTSNAITGTGNVVMSASPTLTGTISAAAATLSGNLTLSGGTANGVLYLDGSKVATSGSALTFDGTLLTRTRPADYSTRFAYDASNYTDIGYFSTNTVAPSNPFWIWYLNGSEGMRLTSTGLGIGTSSPSAKLHVSGGRSYLFSNDNYSLALSRSNVSTNYTYLGTDTSGNLLISETGGATILTLNQSGNLGLGVTPSAWGGSFKAFQIASGGTSLWSDGTVAFYNRNTYYNGTNRIYTVNGYAQEYAQLNDGSHAWKVAASGTAGNAITFTQAMTLDASGNLGVGATSPLTKLHVQVSALSGYSSVANSGILIERGNGPAALNIASPNTESGFIWFADQDSATVGNIKYDHSNNAMSFATNSTERARITSGGDLLVGTTARGLVNSNSFDLDVSDASAYMNHVNGTASGSAYIYFGYNAGSIGSITQNSTTGVLYNITSDYRLKTVTGPVTSAGSRIDALEPVEYTWKSDGSVARGFLAHQFQEVYPNSVTGEKDAVDADGKPVYQNMQASTSEVIADLVAEIKSLRQRVAQLEGASNARA